MRGDALPGGGGQRDGVHLGGAAGHARHVQEDVRLLRCAPHGQAKRLLKPAVLLHPERDPQARHCPTPIDLRFARSMIM